MSSQSHHRKQRSTQKEKPPRTQQTDSTKREGTDTCNPNVRRHVSGTRRRVTWSTETTESMQKSTFQGKVVGTSKTNNNSMIRSSIDAKWEEKREKLFEQIEDELRKSEKKDSKIKWRPLVREWCEKSGSIEYMNKVSFHEQKTEEQRENVRIKVKKLAGELDTLQENLGELTSIRLE